MDKPAGEQIIKAHRLGDHYAQLCDDGSVMPVAVGPEFWQSQIGALPPGEFAVVPKGIWHTADVIEPGEALFVTAGEGTSHRPR